MHKFSASCFKQDHDASGFKNTTFLGIWSIHCSNPDAQTSSSFQIHTCDAETRLTNLLSIVVKIGNSFMYPRLLTEEYETIFKILNKRIKSSWLNI